MRKGIGTRRGGGSTNKGGGSKRSAVKRAEKPGDVREREPSSARVTRELIRTAQPAASTGEYVVWGVPVATGVAVVAHEVKEAAKTAYEWTKKKLENAKDAVGGRTKKPTKKKPAKKKQAKKKQAKTKPADKKQAKQAKKKLKK